MNSKTNPSPWLKIYKLHVESESIKFPKYWWPINIATRHENLLDIRTDSRAVSIQTELVMKTRHARESSQNQEGI